MWERAALAISLARNHLTQKSNSPTRGQPRRSRAVRSTEKDVSTDDCGLCANPTCRWDLSPKCASFRWIDFPCRVGAKRLFSGARTISAGVKWCAKKLASWSSPWVNEDEKRLLLENTFPRRGLGIIRLPWHVQRRGGAWPMLGGSFHKVAIVQQASAAAAGL